VNGIKDGPDAALRQAAPWIERLARVGYAAKGVVYLLVGTLAAKAAFGVSGGRTTDSRGAMREFLGAPYGRTMLGVLAVGLLGYAVWRLVDAWSDAEHPEGGLKRIPVRLGHALTGIVHGGLALTAARFALGEHDAGGRQVERLIAFGFDLPLGRWLVLAVGAGVVLYGVVQVGRALMTDVCKRLTIAHLGADACRNVSLLSRFGIAARGVVFASIGVLVVRAALRYDPNQAGGIDKGLRNLPDGWVFALVALGLAAYGCYELAQAKYRRIRPV